MCDAKNVPDDLRPGHEDLSLPFTTYREQVDGQYWFPVYSKADGILHFSGGKGYMSEDVHLRSIVKYSNYKRFGTSIKITFEGQDITKNGHNPRLRARRPAPESASKSASTAGGATQIGCGLERHANTVI